MNVLLINGSPHTNGCTDAALREVAKALNADGIETAIFHIGAAPVGRVHRLRRLRQNREMRVRRPGGRCCPAG